MSTRLYIVVGGLLVLAFAGGVVRGQTERFELTGNLKFFGAGNGIIFPDGTKQTTGIPGSAGPPGPQGPTGPEGPQGARNVVDSSGTVVGRYENRGSTGVVERSVGAFDYHLKAFPSGLTSAFAIDVSFTTDDCTGVPFVSDSSAVRLSDDFFIAGIFILGGGAASRSVYAPPPGTTAEMFTKESHWSLGTGVCSDEVPTVGLGNQVQFLEVIPSFALPLSLTP